jgi:hypothetical protein
MPKKSQKGCARKGIKYSAVCIVALWILWVFSFGNLLGSQNDGEPLSEHVIEINEHICREFEAIAVPGKQSGLGTAFVLTPNKPVIWVTMPDGLNTYFIARYRHSKKSKCVELKEIGRDPINVAEYGRLSDKWHEAARRAFDLHETNYRQNRWETTRKEFCTVEISYRTNILCTTELR